MTVPALPPGDDDSNETDPATGRQRADVDEDAEPLYVCELENGVEFLDDDGNWIRGTEGAAIDLKAVR